MMHGPMNVKYTLFIVRSIRKQKFKKLQMEYGSKMKNNH